MHLSEELLQAYQDRELSEEEMEHARHHLEMCADCQKQLADFQKSHSEIQRHLDLLVPDSVESPEAKLLFQKVKNASSDTSTRPAWKPAWAAIITIFALSAALYLKPVRVWATEFLSLFRVQKITVVRIDPANVKQLEDGLFGQESERRIEQFLSDNAHVTKRGEERTAQDVNEAARLAGFGIRMPTKLQSPARIEVHPAVDASFEIDVERLQNILNDADRSDVKIPQSLDGKSIQINIPASVTALFGECPDPKEVKETTGRAIRYAECKMLVQLPTPVLVAPPSFDAVQLGTEMLKLFGFTEEQAQSFSKSIDWTTTMVVPLPFDTRMNVVEVDVDGVRGQLFSSRYHGKDSLDPYNLIWIRDGNLYSLMGRGTAEEALAIANSM